MVLKTICFDADDTLWHNERFFRLTEARFVQLLADYATTEDLANHLVAAERRNLERYGYGIKGFVLSMIETALQVTDNQVPGAVIAELIAVGKDMLGHPIELLPGAEAAIEELATDYRLLLITKGDLLNQEQKLARSGLGDKFDGVEIVSEKTTEVYRGIFTGRGLVPDTVMMVGNSLKSDINPVLHAGAWAVHVPFEMTWALEDAPTPVGHPRFREIATLAELPSLVSGIARNI
ncbi:MAG: HAD family hydrolase [Pseudomonadota bacterium]